MPAPTKTSDNLRQAKTSSFASPDRKPAKRQAHRYGRIRREGDEEIVREAQSDYEPSESESTDDDSFSESSAVSLPDSHLPSGTLSQHTPRHSNGRASARSGVSGPGPSSGKILLNALQDPRTALSDAIIQADDEVPVIQFEEMGDLASQEKDNDTGHRAHSGTGSHRGRGSTFRRPIGMTARQAYLRRLENDPAYTPRVGEFWGHDERLIDKDLRSLSGWWRGKWTGRGGSFGKPINREPPPRNGDNVKGRGAHNASEDPMNTNWKHDGYEELKKADEIQQTRNRVSSEAAGRAGTSVSTRGRGRGAIAAQHQINRPSRSHSLASTPSARPFVHGRSQSSNWQRYEHAWTKHSVSFLFQDVLNKPKNGENIGIRVKVPGQARFNVVRIPGTAEETKSPSKDEVRHNPSRSVIVRLPKSAVKITKGDNSNPENVHTISSPPIFDTLGLTATKTQIPEVPVAVNPPTPPSSNDAGPPLNILTSSMEEGHIPSIAVDGSKLQERSDLASSSVPDTSQKFEAPELRLVTALPPLNAPSPAYSSPSYGHGYQYPVPRPATSSAYPPSAMASNEPSVWFDPRMPYGYPTPPPLPGHHMYTPPPGPHAHHHHHHSHSHSHSHSVSHPHMPPPQGTGVAPPYYAQPPLEFHQGPAPEYGPLSVHPPDRRSFSYTPDGAMIDVQTGTPIFSLARPTSKVAIRKPGEKAQAQVVEPASTTTAIGASESSTQPAGGAGRGETAPEKREYQHISVARPYEGQGMPRSEMHPPHPSFVQNQQYWNGYPPNHGGYFYPPASYPMPPPQPSMQEYGYPPPNPSQGYVPGRYTEGVEYQPPVYY